MNEVKYRLSSVSGRFVSELLKTTQMILKGIVNCHPQTIQFGIFSCLFNKHHIQLQWPPSTQHHQEMKGRFHTIYLYTAF